MSAYMPSLRRVMICPREPVTWIDNVCGQTKIDMEVKGIERRNVLDSIAERFVTKGEAIGGLEHGTPCLGTAKTCHWKMVREGKQQQSNCLEAVVYMVWKATRAAVGPQFRKGRKCVAEAERLKHCFLGFHGN